MGEKTTIYALGFFDGVHRGHQLLTAQCRELAHSQALRAGAITFSTHPDAVIRQRPTALLNTVDERIALLKTAGGLDTVVVLPFDSAMMSLSYRDFFRMMVDTYGAAGFVCGEDFRFGFQGQGNGAVLADLCRAEGLPCRILPKLCIGGSAVSSSRIRQLLCSGALSEALELLGHPHLLSGTVIPGKQLGRTLGFPTANLTLSEDILCPPHGVYACMAYTPQGAFPAVTNIGLRPTVAGAGVTVEACLLDYSGDLYGKKLYLAVHRFLRPERKFPSLEDLQAEIQKNARQTRELFHIS